MLDDLEALVGHFVRAGPFERSQLGRSDSKFGSLISLAKGLPSQFVSTTDDELQGYVRELAASLAPYGRIANTARQDLPSAETECEAPASGKNECFEGGVDADECSAEATLPGEFRAPVLKGLSCLPVKADRIKWSLGPSFDPTPFLTDPIVKSVFEDPATLRLAPSFWPSLSCEGSRPTRGTFGPCCKMGCCGGASADSGWGGRCS